MKLFKTIASIYAVALVQSAFPVQLENWRFPFYQEAELQTKSGSSPSGMFWDDIGGGAFLNPALWPDQAITKKNHWIVEPAVSFSARPTDTLFIDTTPPITHYVNDRNLAQESQTTGSYWAGQVLNDIRYKNILVRQVLDVDSRNKTDLDFRGKTDRLAAGRINEAYMQVDWKYGFFTTGTFKPQLGAVSGPKSSFIVEYPFLRRR